MTNHKQFLIVIFLFLMLFLSVLQASENKSVVSSLLKKAKSGYSNAKSAYSGSKLQKMIQTANTKVVTPAGRKLFNAGSAGIKTTASMGKKVFANRGKILGGGLFLAGAAAMAGVAMMNGAMNQAQDIMYERYMRDARYSSRLLSNSNVGIASGNSTLNTGNHVGLSLALSKRRHG